jgi:tRNA-binding EMAP/Myf-like protein
MSFLAVDILSVEPHPNANKLKICKVTDGQEQFQVVCGASNAFAGMRTILAQVGTTLKSGTVIQVSELRGVASNGMLCSAKDLAISNEGGIVDLPAHIVPVGALLEQIPEEFLSSIPWHSYKLVDTHWINPQDGNIHVGRGPNEGPPSSLWKLLSKTYFHQGQYLYRNFQQAALA